MRFLNQFVDSNDREIRRLLPMVDETNELEATYEAMSDEDIRATFAELKAEVLEAAVPDEPSDDERHHPDLERRRELKADRRKRENARLQKALDDVLPEVFAMTREAMKRTLGMRHFDVQLEGAAVLHQGKIAEMRTGEGKTLVAPLAAVLNSMAGRGVHVVTVNDYLARRDPQWMGPVFHFLGVSVGMITHDTSYVFEPGYPTTDERLLNLRPVTRAEAYAADITYGTNNEFGFDYLRDNMVLELDQRVQRERYFAIVDEVDNILIDEARTPLIISGQAEESADLYFTFARLVPRLKERPVGAEEGGDYFIDLKDKAVSSTEEGVEKMEGWLGVENLYDADPRLARHFEQALRAHALYKRDRDYIVKDGEIIIVDEFTGRQMPGRRWSEGLHQAVEAKEGLRVQRESVTLATITFQNYFRLYDKLSGMTGTAMTEAEELHKIYKLEVVAIPTHREMVRDDFADLVYRDEPAKFNALIDEIVEMTEEGRPVLVGTVTVEKSEMLATMLKRRGIKHEVLNAKFHEKESGIVAQAGRSGAVTIATNMAGRGTDILLGGNPAGLASESLHKRGLNPAEVDREIYNEALAEAKAITEADHDLVVAAGGLHIIGTERHDSRRIDNQLRGRAGRQGDPGSSRFYLSLDDDLMKRFASERVTGLMERLGLDDDVAIESRMVSKTIESAQSRVEGFNFDIRKRVVEYDDVINKQRETIYAERDKVLHNEDLTETVQTFLDDEVESLAESHLVGEDPAAWNLEGLSAALVAMGLTGEGTSADDLWECRQPRVDHRPRPGSRRRASRGQGGRGRRRGLEDRRAAGPDPDDRFALGRAPDRDRRHASRHRPPRLRPAGPAERVQARGVPALRRAARPHPTRRGIVDLPRHGQPPAGGPGRGRSGGGRLARPGSGGIGRRQRRDCHADRWPAAGRRPRDGRDDDHRGRRLGRSARRTCRPDHATHAGIARRRARRQRRRHRSLGERPQARLHPVGRADRAQRPVLVRIGREIQEVPRSLTTSPDRAQESR